MLCRLSISDVDVTPSRARSIAAWTSEHIGRMISKDKKVALGVISHRTLQVERPEEVAGPSASLSSTSRPSG